MANTTWNPSDKSSTVTLTGSNLIATATTGSNGGVRTVDAHNSGKYYWEITYTTVNTNSLTTGLALVTADLTFASATGFTNLARLNGNINVNGVASGSSLGAAVAPSSKVGIAVDLTAKLIWFRITPAGNWNGSGTANPATGVGGVNISVVATAAMYPFMSGVSSDAVTANFGDSAFTGAVPSGFTAGWPGVSAPPVDLAGNLGGDSLYGRLKYGVGKYSRIAAFAPTFGADLTVSAGVALFGDLAPTVSFATNLGIVFGVSGDLAPAVSFAADLDVVGFVDLSGDLAPQIALGGSLSLDLALTALEGSFGFTVVYGAAEMISGPLWADTEPCPSPPWGPSEPCPPSLWTPVGPCDPVEWAETELCNG